MRDWIAMHAIEAHNFLMPVADILLAFVVPILILLAIFKKNRGLVGVAMLSISYLFGLVTWLGGAATTFASFGWFLLILGLCFFGVGVVPLGMLGAGFMWHEWGLAGELLLGLVLTFGLRFGGMALIAAAGQAKVHDASVVASQ